MPGGNQIVLVLMLALGALVLLAGCAATQVVDDAKEALDKARDIHGDYLAPYHFASAEAYLQEAVRQHDRSDFKAATKFAKKAHEQALAAYTAAEKAQSVSPVVTAKTFDIESIVFSPRPGQVTEENIARAQKRLAELEAGGAKGCAPLEFARAEACLVFAGDEWRERHYNQAAKYLRRVQIEMESALRFMEDCRPGKE